MTKQSDPILRDLASLSMRVLGRSLAAAATGNLKECTRWRVAAEHLAACIKVVAKED